MAYMTCREPLIWSHAKHPQHSFVNSVYCVISKVNLYTVFLTSYLYDGYSNKTVIQEQIGMVRTH